MTPYFAHIQPEWKSDQGGQVFPTKEEYTRFAFRASAIWRDYGEKQFRG